MHLSLLTLGLLAPAVPALRLQAERLAPRRTQPSINSDWDTRKAEYKKFGASTALKWYNCFHSVPAGQPHFQCAKLTVPLDYSNAKAGTMNVAYIRYLVNNAYEDLVFNPGGPGETGIGDTLIIAADWAKKWPGYNIVSFDPRGVGVSGLNLNCHAPSKKKRADIGDQSAVYDANVAYNAECYRNTVNGKAKYVGTLANVQDMMHFTELSAVKKNPKANPKLAKINYYGISYGTLMGQTLVATYPSRVRRVLLDGNVYGVNWYKGWEPTVVTDFAKAVQQFSNLCYSAGPSLCALAQNATSGADVKALFDTAVNLIAQTPLGSYGISDFLMAVQTAMIYPRGTYQDIVKYVAGVLHAEGDPRFQKRDGSVDNPNWEAVSQVAAIDTAGRYPWKTYQQWVAAAQVVQNTYPYGGIGLYSDTNGLGSVGQTLIPPASQTFAGFKPVKPSAKVLFINTNGDPVCPDYGAQQMMNYFAGSGLIIVDASGHGFQTAPSKQAYDLVANYWKTGNVPSKPVTVSLGVSANYFFDSTVPEPSWS